MGLHTAAQAMVRLIAGHVQIPVCDFWVHGGNRSDTGNGDVVLTVVVVVDNVDVVLTVVVVVDNVDVVLTVVVVLGNVVVVGNGVVVGNVADGGSPVVGNVRCPVVLVAVGTAGPNGNGALHHG
jgi:hypothetical protein